MYPLESRETKPEVAMNKRYENKITSFSVIKYNDISLYHLCGENENIDAENLKSIFILKIPYMVKRKNAL